MERVYTEGGSDVSQDSKKYMWLKKHLQARGVDPAEIQKCYGVPSLYNLGIQHGVLTTAPSEGSGHNDVSGASGLPIAVDIIESEDADAHMAQADEVEAKEEAAAEKPAPPEEVSGLPPIEARFDLEDPAWMKHLDEEGFCVIKGVATEEEVETAKKLVWDQIEGAKGIQRDNLESWNKWRIDKRGFPTDFLPQSEGPWYLRGLPRVKQCFERIWEESDLLVSMDAIIIWKPWWYEGKRWPTPKPEGLHLDQNPFHRPKRESVQGMMPLYPVTDKVGGLRVVPRSQSAEGQKALKAHNPAFSRPGDWCVLSSEDPMQADARLILAEPGDFILWDSRAVHGGFVGNGGDPAEQEAQVARMSMTICMTPRSCATPQVLEDRKEAFQLGVPTNHWPHYTDKMAGALQSARNNASMGILKYTPIELTPEQQALM